MAAPGVFDDGEQCVDAPIADRQIMTSAIDYLRWVMVVAELDGARHDS